jgi:hypothetical protein
MTCESGSRRSTARSRVASSRASSACSEDLGGDHFDRRAKGKQILRLVSRIQILGLAVQIAPIAAAE